MPRLEIRDQVYLGNGYKISQIDGKRGWYLHKKGQNGNPRIVTKFAHKAAAESFYYEWKHGGLQGSLPPAHAVQSRVRPVG